MGRVELDFQSTCTSRARSDHHGRGCYISGVECEACLRWSEGLLDLLARGEESIVDKETKRVADPDIHDELPHVNSTQFALELHVNAASMVPLENEMVENKDAEKFREKMPFDNIIWDEELASDGNTHDGLLQQLAEVEDQTQYKKVCTVLSESEAQVYDEILGKVVWDEEMSSELDMDNDLLGLLVSGGEYPVDEQVVDDSSDFKEFGLVDADHVFVEGLDEDSKAVCKASMSDELTLEINTPFLFGVAIDHVNEMPVNINLQDGLSQERASGREYVYDDKMDPIVEPDFDLSFAVSIQEEWDIQSLVRVPEQDLILKICEQYHGGQPIVLTCQYMIQTDHHFGGTRKGDNEQRGVCFARTHVAWGQAVLQPWARNAFSPGQVEQLHQIDSAVHKVALELGINLPSDPSVRMQWDPGISTATAWGQAVFRGAGKCHDPSVAQKKPSLPAHLPRPKPTLSNPIAEAKDHEDKEELRHRCRGQEIIQKEERPRNTGSSSSSSGCEILSPSRFPLQLLTLPD